MASLFKKLLVIDDSLTIQKVIKLALAQDEYALDVLSEGSQVLEQISLIQPDIVLIDNSLPGKSGLDIKHELNQHPLIKSIPFVLMMSAFETIDEAKIEQLGFSGVLTKPFDPTQLRTCITEALAKTKGEKVTPEPLVLEALSEWENPHSLDPNHHVQKNGEWDLGLDFKDKKGKDELRQLTDTTLAMIEAIEKNAVIAPDGFKENPAFDPLFKETAVHNEAPIPASTPVFEPPSFLSDQHIETLINQKLDRHLNALTQQVVYQIAERLIKEEIHRILMD